MINSKEQSKNMRYIFFCAVLTILCQSASPQESTIKDVDGNVYKTVRIGTQVWMAENLKTAHYRDSLPISEIELNSSWDSAKIGVWCYYQGDPGINPIYGKLYNCYAVTGPRNVCPTGWHVPSDSEWTVLTDYLGGDTVAGGKMKATTLWRQPNTGADNSSGFMAVPGGKRAFDFGGTFDNLGLFGNFWSSTELSGDIAWSRYLSYNNSIVTRYFDYKGNDLSVRCIGD